MEKLFKFASNLKQKFQRNQVDILINVEDFLKCDKFFELCGFSLLVRVEAGRASKFFISSLVIIFLFILESLVSLVVYLVQSESLLLIVENSADVAVMVLALSKAYWCLFYNRDQIKEVIEKLDENFPHLNHDQHAFGIRKYLKELKVISWLLVFVYLGAATHFLTFTFQRQVYCWINSENCLMDPVMPHWFPFDVLSPFAFLVTFIWYTWTILIGGLLLLTTDILYAALMTILSMEFDILAAKIEVTRDSAEMKKLIRVHQQLIDVAGKLEEIYSPLLFVNVFLVTSALCFAAFLTLMDLSPAFMMKYFVCFLFILSNGFILCYYAQKLTDSSSSVTFAAYSTPWYEMDLLFRKLVVIVMIIAQEGKKLTAWSFFDVSMETFYWILDTAYSYYSVLMGLYEP